MVSSTIFWVFGMNRPEIKPQSPGSLANTQPTFFRHVYLPLSVHINLHQYVYIYLSYSNKLHGILNIKRLIKKNTPTKNTRTHSWKRKKRREKEKRERENPVENLSQTTPSEHSPLYKPKTSQNYQIFSEDSKKLEIRVRKNKTNI